MTEAAQDAGGGPYMPFLQGGREKTGNGTRSRVQGVSSTIIWARKDTDSPNMQGPWKKRDRKHELAWTNLQNRSIKNRLGLKLGLVTDLL